MMQPEITQTNVVLLPKQNGPAWLWHKARRFGNMIQKKFWLVLLVTVSALVATFVCNELQTPLYESVTTVQFKHSQNVPPAFDEIDFYAAVWKPETVLNEITSDAIFAKLTTDKEITSIIKTENADTVPPPSEINKRIRSALSVSHDPARDLYLVAARDPNPFLTRAIANKAPEYFNLIHSDSASENTADSFKDDLQSLHRTAEARQLHLLHKSFKPHLPAFHQPNFNFLQTVTTTSDSLQSTASRAKFPKLSVPNLLKKQNVQIAMAQPSASSTFENHPLNLELKEIEEAQAVLRQKLVRLENGLKAPYQIPDPRIRSAYQASVTAKAKLENWLKNYQIPPEEQAKLKQDIAAKTANFQTQLRNAIAATRSEITQLQIKKNELKAQFDRGWWGKNTPPALPPVTIPAPSMAKTALKKFHNSLFAVKIPVRKTPDSVNPKTLSKPVLLPIPISNVPSADSLRKLLKNIQHPNYPLTPSPGNFIYLSKAERPENPVLPDKKFNLAITAVMGIFAGCLIAAFWGFHDEVIDSPGDIEKEFQIPVLALIPKLKE